MLVCLSGVKYCGPLWRDDDDVKDAVLLLQQLRWLCVSIYSDSNSSSIDAADRQKHANTLTAFPQRCYKVVPEQLATEKLASLLMIMI